jgi:hypothetical protein
VLVITQWGCITSLKVYKNLLGSITYLLKRGRVLPKPTRKTFGEIYKQHGLNYFALIWHDILNMD